MALVEIASFADRAIGEMVRGRLAAEGVEALLFDGGIASLGLGGLIPARLMVDEADRLIAERLLSTFSA